MDNDKSKWGGLTRKALTACLGSLPGVAATCALAPSFKAGNARMGLDRPP